VVGLKRRNLFVLAGAVALLAAVVIPLAGATGLHPVAGKAARACGVTVRAMDGSKVAINQYMQDNMHFSPGIVHVVSGCTLTFKYGTPNQMEPHTMTIVPASKLPRTVAQVENCKVCNVALGHLKNPKSPQTAGTPANPLIHPVLQAGKPSQEMTIDGTPGDSIAIEPVPGHRSITVTITAPSGSVLHFICAVHPWMQGTLIVS
jgi:plastocyanin